MRLSMLTLLCTICALSVLSTNAHGAERQKEKQLIDGKNISITTRQELTFKARADADVKTRELWYRRAHSLTRVALRYTYFHLDQRTVHNLSITVCAAWIGGNE